MVYDPFPETPYCEPDEQAEPADNILYAKIAKACKGKQEPSKIDLLDWVFNHVGLSPHDIPAKDFPSPGAARLLIQANEDYPSFLILWRATIPNQTQLKLHERAKEDGRATPLLDALEIEFARSTDGYSGEHPLPKKDSGSWRQL